MWYWTWRKPSWLLACLHSPERRRAVTKASRCCWRWRWSISSWWWWESSEVPRRQTSPPRSYGNWSTVSGARRESSSNWGTWWTVSSTTRAASVIQTWLRVFLQVWNVIEKKMTFRKFFFHQGWTMTLFYIIKSQFFFFWNTVFIVFLTIETRKTQLSTWEVV